MVKKMNKKTILIIGLIVIAALASISLASAIDINLPDGFELDDSETVENQTKELFGVETDWCSYFMTNGTDNITVDTFLPHKEIDLTESNGSTFKTINNTYGLYQEVDGRHIFVYSDDVVLVQIDAPTEELIGEVIR